MNRTLILYSTVDGHTLRICKRIADVLLAGGELVELCDIEAVDEALLAQHDKVLVGASIRYGKHRPALFEFGRRYHALLDDRINGFFTVNVVARKPFKNTPKTNPYMQKFLGLSAWQPQQLGVFAGKIDYSKYRLFDRTMIRFIMWLTKGPTDIRGTFEFTDWEMVDTFARAFNQR
ncbi:MAG: menaquinone-dependent protoporphyrinogen IX dehydrogenase [Shewanella sp.]|nr:menaquinone-dependent protoporphyrinogen IX dehydrogenase [Shewanella sp.]MCF1431240.1 menaquinone-dependent protoporphyrinogen IX dehydrogenase [Shewanella sp.]MCF1437877.1 menaquinone-dependent protoporphyrinogen IX dehydrogenase [Shewanella sp.]MCF1457331.1 menaquinone-dependent protoporphyrinogen IX dehydrogenase [Shewanella sp.]